jgi:hypothetical protein
MHYVIHNQDIKDLEGQFCTHFRLLKLSKMAFPKKKTAHFEGSAGFEETETLFLEESALRNPFVPGKVPPRCILHVVHLEVSEP